MELMDRPFTHSHCLESVTITHKMDVYGYLAFADCPKLTSFVFTTTLKTSMKLGICSAVARRLRKSVCQRN